MNEELSVERRRELSRMSVRRYLDSMEDRRPVEALVSEANAMMDPKFTPEQAEQAIKTIMAMDQRFTLEGDNGVRSISKEKMIEHVRRRTVRQEDQ